MVGKKAFNEQDALQKAIQVFWSKGYEGAGTEELLQAMGIGRQSMYSWVGDKKGLFIKCLNFYTENYMKPLIDLHKQPGSPLENLRSLIRKFADYAQTEECLGCLVTNAISEFGPEDERISPTLEEIENTLQDAFEKVLINAKEAGEITDKVDIPKTARTLAVMRNGIMLAGKTGYNKQAAYDTIEMIDLILNQ